MIDAVFRFATSSDVDALIVLIERAYRSEEAAGTWASEADLLKGPRTSISEVSALIADTQSRILVAQRAETIAGCCLVQRRPDHAAYFGLFAIDPGLGGTGLGKAVLAEAEEAVQALWACDQMVMTVINLRTALIDWYRRRGYHETGATLPFPFTKTSGETTRDFHLVEMRKGLS